METDFVYWRHHTPVGVKVEEISGGENRLGALWTSMAYQVYSENGRDEFREIGHFACGAPFLLNSPERISVSHTKNKLVVATLPPSPDEDLNLFSPATALGVDVESADRSQVLKLRERFLSDDELELVAADDVVANITAWTSKEALYKAGMGMNPDFRKAIRINRLPVPAKEEEWLRYISSADKPDLSEAFGEASLLLPSGDNLKMNLFSYWSDNDIVTLAYSDQTLRFRTP